MHIITAKTKNKKTGAVYINHKLVESVRTELGPRNRIIMNLGNLDLSKDDLKKLSMVLEARIRGQQSLFEAEENISSKADQIMAHFDFKRLHAIEAEQKKAIEENTTVKVYLDKTTYTESRSLGPELVAHHMWQKLKLDEILRGCGFKDLERELAEVAVISRLVEPGSELQCWEWIKNRTALSEILNEDLVKVSKDSIYNIADQLLASKEHIETALVQIEGNMFNGRSTLFLYDLTNTYFEGQCKANHLAKRGKSKEKRNDCLQVTLALLVDQRGFPIFSQIYEGGQSECETLEQVLNRLEEDIQGKLFCFKPTLVMDRGIATADNIALLKAKKYPYVVIERRDAEKEYGEEFSKAKEEFETITSDTSTVYIKKIIDGQMARLLVLSEGKKEKEEAMDKLKEQRLLSDLNKLKKSIKSRNVIVVEKIAQRIGRIMERYPSVAKYYEIKLTPDATGKEASDINWSKKALRDERSVLTGCYVIETTHQELDAREIFNIYHTLTQVEYAFRCLKTDLGVRPVYHQIARRTRGHLFISVLAYHLLIAIETSLREHGDKRKWSTIKKVLSTHTRSTVILQGEKEQVHYIRISGQPEIEHQKIYKTLRVNDPLKMRKVTLQHKSST
jgi:transposase